MPSTGIVGTQRWTARRQNLLAESAAIFLLLSFIAGTDHDQTLAACFICMQANFNSSYSEGNTGRPEVG